MGRCKQAEHCINHAWCKLTGKCLKAQPEPAAWVQHHKAGDNLEWEDPGGKRTALFHATDVQQLLDEIQRLQTEVTAAIPAMRHYAQTNPKHHFSTDGTEQDPNGAHAWLARNGA